MYYSAAIAVSEDQLHGNSSIVRKKNLGKGHPSRDSYELASRQKHNYFLASPGCQGDGIFIQETAHILNQFSVKANTTEAEILKLTIKEGEEPGVKGEKYFTTSEATTLMELEHIQYFMTFRNFPQKRGFFWKPAYLLKGIRHSTHQGELLLKKSIQKSY